LERYISVIYNTSIMVTFWASLSQYCYKVFSLSNLLRFLWPLEINASWRFWKVLLKCGPFYLIICIWYHTFCTKLLYQLTH